MQCPRGTATIRAVPAAEADSCLDTRGLVCPEPLLLVRNRVREMRRGEILNVLATDPTIGYLVMDLNRHVSEDVRAQVAALDTSIRTRILY